MTVVFGEADASRTGRQKLYAVRQRNRTINEYLSEWKSALTHIPKEAHPNEYDQMFFFQRGLDDKLREATALDLATNKPFTTMEALTSAALHIGHTIPASSSNHQSNNSHQGARNNRKLTNGDNTSASPVPKRPFKKAEDYPGFTPKRSQAEQKYLMQHQLCFHCCGKVDKDGKEFRRRPNTCPFKESKVAASPLPADFSSRRILLSSVKS